MIRAIGRYTIGFISEVGSVTLLMMQTIRAFFHRPFPLANLFEQMVKIGWNSLPVTFFTALATGAILSLQTGYALMSQMKGSEQFVGGVVALAVARELGPVLCALMVGGRAGSGITAEIGTMKVTEQIDALYTLSADPIKFLVVPRVLAGFIMLPVLTIFTDFVAIIGGMLVGVLELGVNETQYLRTTLDFISMKDVSIGLIKSLVFGIIITLLSSYQGFRTGGGAEGVGKATTRAVVIVSMSILFWDYALSSLLSDLFF